MSCEFCVLVYVSKVPMSYELYVMVYVSEVPISYETMCTRIRTRHQLIFLEFGEFFD
jgi:hypothetical protein